MASGPVRVMDRYTGTDREMKNAATLADGGFADGSCAYFFAYFLGYLTVISLSTLSAWSTSFITHSM
jgi:hypothetical protein